MPSESSSEGATSYPILMGTGFKLPDPHRGILQSDETELHGSLDRFLASFSPEEIQKRVEHFHRQGTGIPEGEWRLSQAYTGQGEKIPTWGLDGNHGFMFGVTPKGETDTVWLAGVSFDMSAPDDVKRVVPFPHIPTVVQMQACHSIRDVPGAHELDKKVRDTLENINWEQTLLGFFTDWAHSERFPVVYLQPAQRTTYWKSDAYIQYAGASERDFLIQRNRALLKHYNEAARGAKFIPLGTDNEQETERPWIYALALTEPKEVQENQWVTDSEKEKFG
jgi:hypothetical protein